MTATTGFHRIHSTDSFRALDRINSVGSFAELERSGSIGSFTRLLEVANASGAALGPPSSTPHGQSQPPPPPTSMCAGTLQNVNTSTMPQALTGQVPGLQGPQADANLSASSQLPPFSGMSMTNLVALGSPSNHVMRSISRNPSFLISPSSVGIQPTLGSPQQPQLQQQLPPQQPPLNSHAFGTALPGTNGTPLMASASSVPRSASLSNFQLGPMSAAVTASDAIIGPDQLLIQGTGTMAVTGLTPRPVSKGPGRLPSRGSFTQRDMDTILQMGTLGSSQNLLQYPDIYPLLRTSMSRAGSMANFFAAPMDRTMSYPFLQDIDSINMAQSFYMSNMNGSTLDMMDWANASGTNLAAAGGGNVAFGTMGSMGGMPASTGSMLNFQALNQGVPAPLHLSNPHGVPPTPTLAAAAANPNAPIESVRRSESGLGLGLWTASMLDFPAFAASQIKMAEQEALNAADAAMKHNKEQQQGKVEDDEDDEDDNENESEDDEENGDDAQDSNESALEEERPNHASAAHIPATTVVKSSGIASKSRASSARANKADVRTEIKGVPGVASKGASKKRPRKRHQQALNRLKRQIEVLKSRVKVISQLSEVYAAESKYLINIQDRLAKENAYFRSIAGSQDKTDALSKGGSIGVLQPSFGVDQFVMSSLPLGVASHLPPQGVFGPGGLNLSPSATAAMMMNGDAAMFAKQGAFSMPASGVVGADIKKSGWSSGTPTSNVKSGKVAKLPSAGGKKKASKAQT